MTTLLLCEKRIWKRYKNKQNFLKHEWTLPISEWSWKLILFCCSAVSNASNDSAELSVSQPGHACWPKQQSGALRKLFWGNKGGISSENKLMFINENKVFFPAVRGMMDIGVIVCDHDVLLYLLARCWLLWHLPCIHWQLGTGDSPDHPPNISSEKCPMKEKQNLVVVLECCWETFFNKFEIKVLHQVQGENFSVWCDCSHLSWHCC